MGCTTVVRRQPVMVALLRETLEAQGLALVVLSRQGRVRLITSQALAWMQTYFVGGLRRPANRLPEALQRWVRQQEARQIQGDGGLPSRRPLLRERAGRCLVIRHLCGPTACLLLFEEAQKVPPPTTVQPFGLSQREGEVLTWVAQGKTNSEIGQILGISHRTVGKHLERVYQKLGVECRMAAATHLLALTPLRSGE